MRAPPKLVCLESYWNERLFQTFSVKGFFEAMAPLVHPPLAIAHRFVDSGAGLEHYAKRGGVPREMLASATSPCNSDAKRKRPSACV